MDSNRLASPADQATVQISRLIDTWIPSKIKSDKVPGFSVGIMQQGRLIYKQGFGFANLDLQIETDDQTLYQIASISKTFTAVALMQLKERGKLQLDDPAAKYIDWLQGKSKQKDASAITLRQILSHSSGIFRDGDTPHWVTGEFPMELQSAFSERSLIMTAAKSFKYSNYGFALLGLVIEKVSGLSFEAYIHKHIFEPLDMKDTSVDFRDGLSNLATGYGVSFPDENREAFLHYKTNAYAPATGFISNVSDLAKYLSALCLDNYGNIQILGRASKEALLQVHRKTLGKGEYALGFDVMKMNNRKPVGHSGGFPGFITGLLVDPQDGLGVIVLSNAIDSSAYSMAVGIFQALTELIDHPKKYTHFPTLSFEKYEGVYRNIWGDSVITRFGTDLLCFSPTVNSPFVRRYALLKRSKIADQFIIKAPDPFEAVDEPLTFTNFQNGQAQEVFFGSTPAKRVVV